LRDRIRQGEITCTVRLWQRPHVKVGGRYPLAPGRIVVTQMFEIALSEVTPDWHDDQASRVSWTC